MSLPTVPFLKDQAERLVSYLGDKHRFRLKAASALEAVAAIYRQADWNTLHALARDDTPAAVRTSHASSASPATYPVSWTSFHEPELTVNANDWFRHTLAEGGTRAERQAWLQLHLMALLQRGGPGVFVNAYGEDQLRVRDVHEELKQRSGNTAAPEFCLNLMADMEPSEIATLLVALAAPLCSASDSDYMQQSGAASLEAAAETLRSAGEAVTLARLLDVPALFSAYAGTGSRHPLARALEEIHRAPWTKTLLSDEASAPGVFSLLEQGKCLVIESAQDGRPAGTAVLYALRSAFRRRMQMSSADRAQDWVFGLGEVPEYLSPALSSILERSRGAQVAVVMTARDGRELGIPRGDEALLANVYNKLQLGGLSQQRREELVAELEGKTVMRQPGRLTAAL